MTTKLTIALRRYPHTTPILDGAERIDGVDAEFVDIEPIHRAFLPMVRELRYDVCELAIATYFQAIEAGVPVVALPVAVHGNFHYRSISTLRDSGLSAADLAGHRVGVRSYSQTTGLWVRGFLQDDYGVAAKDVTWVTTEPAHVESYREPANVTRIDGRLGDALSRGQVDAVLMGRRSTEYSEDFQPLIADWAARQERFFANHQWVPINHVVVTRRELLQSDPDAVRSVYRALCRGIDGTRTETIATNSASRAIQYGTSDTMLTTLGTALRYAREQELIRTDITTSDLFSDFTGIER